MSGESFECCRQREEKRGDFLGESGPGASLFARCFSCPVGRCLVQFEWDDARVCTCTWYRRVERWYGRGQKELILIPNTFRRRRSGQLYVYTYEAYIVGSQLSKGASIISVISFRLDIDGTTQRKLARKSEWLNASMNWAQKLRLFFTEPTNWI